MANEASIKKVDDFFTEPIAQKQDIDRLPALVKSLKLKFGNDGKQIHRVPIKFLNNGMEIEIPDNFNTNSGNPIKKRVFEVEWEKNKYALFVNKSVTSDSLYSQIKTLGIKNKSNLINVNCSLTITGRIGDKTMRYVIEDAPTPNGVNPIVTIVNESVKDYSGDEFEVVRLMKSKCKNKDDLISLSYLSETLGFTAEKLNGILLKLTEKSVVFGKNVGKIVMWGLNQYEF